MCDDYLSLNIYSRAAYIYIHRQTDRQTDRHTDTHVLLIDIHRQTDRQTDRQTYIHTYMQILTCCDATGRER